MIYTQRNIVIRKDTATIDSPILLFRGDREVEIQFTIVNSKFRFESNKGNIIDSTQASYGQLAIALPDGTDLFSDVAETQNGVVIFNITGEMIDELHEVGFYSFHIRLYNDDQTSRITLPPVMEGIEIREPLVIDDDTADSAIVGYSTIQIYGAEEPAFDENGNYIKTDWQTGDKITASKLNKIEETLETINNDIPSKTSELVNDSNFLTTIPSEYITETELNAKGYLTEHQDISNKADKSEIPTKTSQLTNDSNFLTSVPSEYVTDSELNAKGYLTEHQDISNKADKSEIPTKTSQLTNDSNFLTTIPSEYITETELNAKGYLTEHQDLSAYAKTADIPTKTSELTNDNGLISNTELTSSLTLGYGEDNKLYIFYNGVSIGVGVEVAAMSGDVTGIIDEDNNIILSGYLTNGAYTIKYKYEDGSFSDAITVTIGDVEKYKNLLLEAQEEGLTGVYNSVGYKENMRWSGSSNAFVSASDCVLTGLIPIGDNGDIFHIRGVDMVGYTDGRQSGWYHCYDSQGSRIKMSVDTIKKPVISSDENGDFTITMDYSVFTIPTGTAYIRFQFGKINGDFTISRNFLIP